MDHSQKFLLAIKSCYTVLIISHACFLGTTTPNKWIFHLGDGAWCFDKDECAARTKIDYGSSKNWPDTFSFSEGLISDNCTANPHFCGWSVVYVGYCDGASFSGNV